MNAMKTLGVPYSAQDIGQGTLTLEKQGKAIAEELSKQGIAVDWDSQMVALIAYLQRLGKPAAQTASK
jgi:cytochrome c oxidase cbb3-type subunit I/II